MKQLKLLTYFLIVCLLAGSFIGCSSSSPSPKKKKGQSGKKKGKTSKKTAKANKKTAVPFKSNIEWGALEKSKNSKGTLVSEAGKWTSGATSTKVLPAEKDGFVEFIAPNKQNLVVGLASKNEDVGFASIDYGIHLNNKGHTKVRENGVIKKSKATKYVKGDKVRIAREKGKIKYSKNGKVFYTSKEDSNTELMVDVSFYSKSSKLNARVSPSFEAKKVE